MRIFIRKFTHEISQGSPLGRRGRPSQIPRASCELGKLAGDWSRPHPSRNICRGHNWLVKAATYESSYPHSLQRPYYTTICSKRFGRHSAFSMFPQAITSFIWPSSDLLGNYSLVGRKETLCWGLAKTTIFCITSECCPILYLNFLLKSFHLRRSFFLLTGRHYSYRELTHYFSMFKEFPIKIFLLKSKKLRQLR